MRFAMCFVEDASPSARGFDFTIAPRPRRAREREEKKHSLHVPFAGDSDGSERAGPPGGQFAPCMEGLRFPGADRSGHGDAEPAGSSHRPSRVFNVYICSARLPPCACSLACYSSNGIFQPQSTSRPPTAPAHTPAPACTPRCFGYRNHTPESPALPMQSPAASVSRSRHLTVCGGVSLCGHASVSGRHASRSLY